MNRKDLTEEEELQLERDYINSHHIWTVEAKLSAYRSRQYQKSHTDYESPKHQEARSLGLSSHYRYANGTYKSRKAGIQPIRAMVKARFPGVSTRFRVYGDRATEMTSNQQALCHTQLRSMKQTYRDLIRTGQQRQYKRKRGMLVYK